MMNTTEHRSVYGARLHDRDGTSWLLNYGTDGVVMTWNTAAEAICDGRRFSEHQRGCFGALHVTAEPVTKGAVVGTTVEQREAQLRAKANQIPGNQRMLPTLRIDVSGVNVHYGQAISREAFCGGGTSDSPDKSDDLVGSVVSLTQKTMTVRLVSEDAPPYRIDVDPGPEGRVRVVGPSKTYLFHNARDLHGRISNDETQTVRLALRTAELAQATKRAQAAADSEGLARDELAEARRAIADLTMRLHAAERKGRRP